MTATCLQLCLGNFGHPCKPAWHPVPPCVASFLLRISYRYHRLVCTQTDIFGQMYWGSVRDRSLKWICLLLLFVRRVWRYQRVNQNPYIEEEQTTQWPKEKVQKDKQRSTKRTRKTKDRVTWTPLKTWSELRGSGRVSSFCSTALSHLWKESLNCDGQQQISTKRTIPSHLNLINRNMTTTFDVENPCNVLWQPQKCGGIKSISLVVLEIFVRKLCKTYR